MNGVLEVLLALMVVAYVIKRQLRSSPLRGKRLIVMPVVLTVVGAVSLARSGIHPSVVDIACLSVGALVALAVGIGQGGATVLEEREGVLWSRMPAWGLWWWAALIASRIAVMVIAHGLDARLAASTAPLLLMLGVNRVGQAVVIATRVLAGPVPFAPEKDGSTFPAPDSAVVSLLGRQAARPSGRARGGHREYRK
ncbi:hypothetical protein ACFXDJ_05020 [Streptomyces sp. NPDC059443]|uniref:hypothetical protein n=1 Tax=unclassified Streptomyces TaxID=2593676 RepID=UPI0036C1A3A9